MGRVERETGNVIVDGNPPGQHGGQMNLAFGFVYVLDHDRHSPVLSKGSGLGVNFLAWRSWAFGHNRARLGIPPEGIIRGSERKLQTRSTGACMVARGQTLMLIA